MKTSARGTIISSKNAINAERFFTLQMLNPKATMGSRVVRMKSDDTQLPTVGYNFNSVFTVSPTIAEGDISFKIMFTPSPLIIAEIFSSQPVTISGHRSFTNQIENGYQTYVIGSKVGQLGEIDQDFNFSPKSDWSKYRCIGYSAGSQWVGREIDKSGVVYAARMNESVTLDEFDPTSKQDSIFSRAFQEQTFAGLHKEPVYDWMYVDENDAAVDEPDKQPDDHVIKMKIGLAVRDILTQEVPTPNPAVVDFVESTFNNFDQYFKTGPSSDNQGFINETFAIFDRQWKITNATANGVKEYHYPTVVNTTLRLVPRQPGKLQTFHTQYSVNAGLLIVNDNFYEAITTVLAQRLAGDFNAIKLQDYFVAIGFDITATIKLDNAMVRRRNRSGTIVNMVARSILDDNAGLFVDDTWSNPVAEYRFPNSGKDSCIMIQFVHVTNYELIVADTSIISNFAIASKSTGRNDIVDFKSAKMQKIMQAIPPMITLDSGMIGQTAQTELASRGIIADIANVLGPLATMVFPEFKPAIGLVQGLANKFDSLNII